MQRAIELPKREWTGMTFGGLIGANGRAPVYPRWLHKDGAEPILAKCTEDEEKARADGYDNLAASACSNRFLINWYWDLEDFSPRQLVIWCKEEFGVDLPIEAGQERLYKAAVELTRHAPQNRNRLVLMAHTLKMKYDATLDEIRRAVDHPDKTWECETETMEVWL